MAKNIAFENLLRSLGLQEDDAGGDDTFRYVPDYPLAKIDVERSRDNQARFEQPIVQATVEEYTQAVKDGADFPGIGLVEKRKAKVLDGNHRVAGYLGANKKTIPAYIIKTDAKREHRILAFANARHGKALTKEEKIRHAHSLHIQYGDAINNLARQFSMSERVLQAGFKHIKVTDFCAAHNINAADFTANQSDAILPLINLDDSLAADVAKVVADTDMPADKLSSFTSKLKRVTSVPERRKMVSEWKKSSEVTLRLADKGAVRVGRKMSRFSQSGRVASAVSRLRDALSPKSLQKLVGLREHKSVEKSLRELDQIVVEAKGYLQGKRKAS